MGTCLVSIQCRRRLTWTKADITDPHRHFETHVPARAVQEPILRSAIFAFSSRHIERQKGEDTEEALQYHNQCLQMLIPAFSGVGESITEVILAAVAILRQHEEMDCMICRALHGVLS